jgi:hypothetical protein
MRYYRASNVIAHRHNTMAQHTPSTQVGRLHGDTLKKVFVTSRHIGTSTWIYTAAAVTIQHGSWYTLSTLHTKIPTVQRLAVNRRLAF